PGRIITPRTIPDLIMNRHDITVGVVYRERNAPLKKPNKITPLEPGTELTGITAPVRQAFNMLICERLYARAPIRWRCRDWLRLCHKPPISLNSFIASLLEMLLNFSRNVISSPWPQPAWHFHNHWTESVRQIENEFR